MPELLLLPGLSVLAAQLRTVDVLGLEVTMLVGIALVYFEVGLGAMLLRLFQPFERLRPPGSLFDRFYARFVAMLFGVWAGGVASLCLVGLIKLRPDPNPARGVLLVTGVAGIILLGLATYRSGRRFAGDLRQAVATRKR